MRVVRRDRTCERFGEAETMRRETVLGVTLLGLVVLAGLARADEIKVLQPNGGTYAAGSALVIKWDYTFMEGMPQTAAEKAMRIELLHFTETGAGGHGGGTAWTLDRTIAEVDVLATKYTWAIPLFVGGPNQVIRITMVKRPALTATSAPFTITRAMVAQPQAVPAALGIQVSSPEGGKTYYIGDTVPIVWSKALLQDQGNVWLFVCWPDRTTCGGGYPVANSGSYSWTIAEAEPHDLVVKVLSHDEKHSGFSGVFHVKRKLHMVPGAVSSPLKLKKN